jgi:hypothetical protein
MIREILNESVNTNEKIGEIKKKLALKVNLPVESISIYHNRIEQKDDTKTPAQCGITADYDLQAKIVLSHNI